MEKKVEYSISLLFFWLKGYIAVDSRFVKIQRGNTIFGFIPAGKDNHSIPLKNISSAMISSQYKSKPILFGAFIIILALAMMSDNFFGGLFTLAIGVGVLGSGLQTILILQRSGSDYLISVPFFDKHKLITIQNEITEALAYDADKTDLNLYMQRKS